MDLLWVLWAVQGAFCSWSGWEEGGEVLGWSKLTNRLRSNGFGASVEFTEGNCRWGKCWGISFPNTLKASYIVR